MTTSKPKLPRLTRDERKRTAGLLRRYAAIVKHTPRINDYQVNQKGKVARALAELVYPEATSQQEDA